MSARTFDFCTRASREASPLACRTSSSSHARSKWSSSERLLRPVMTRTSESPARTASSTTYWIAGLSTTGSISFGCALVAGRKRVPRPAAGMTALVTDPLDMRFLLRRRPSALGLAMVGRPRGPGHRATGACGLGPGRGRPVCWTVRAAPPDRRRHRRERPHAHHGDTTAMPTYEYRCKDCGHEFEAVQSFTDDAI